MTNAVAAVDRRPAGEANELVVGPLAAAPGQRCEGRIPVLTLSDGTEIGVPICLVNGARPGPTVYIQAVSDGDELNGLGVVRQVLAEVTPEALSGRLIVAPVVNWSAMNAHQHTSPLDGKKMNRCFPGKKQGSPSERVAHALFHLAVLQADLALDLHQGSVRPMIDEVRVRVGGTHRLHAECLEMARVFGIGYLLDERGPRGQLARAAPDRGIPTIDPELGGCHGWDPASIEKGVRGVRNVLRRYGLLPGEPELPAEQWVVRRMETARCDQGGVVEYCAALYDRVKIGQPIAAVSDVFGNHLETVAAPADGILWSKALYPLVSSGDSVATIGVEPRRL